MRGVEKGRQAREAGKANKKDKLWAYLWARARHPLKRSEGQERMNGDGVDNFVAVVDFVSFGYDLKITS